MVLMDYHALTIDEPRTAPARKQQYLVICAVMAGAFVYTLLTSGLLDSIQIGTGTFPGGTFMFKNSTRDYAASMGLMDEIGNTYNISRSKYADLLYHLYLDHPWKVGGDQQRFATGIVMKNKKDYPPILDKSRILKDKTRLQAFQQQDFDYSVLPSHKASVTQFPHSLGFVSALIVSYKVLPALMKHAINESGPGAVSPVVLMTCAPNERMCTYYAPHATTKNTKAYQAFWLGQEDADTYMKTCETGIHALVDIRGIQRDVIKVVTWPYNFFLGGNKKSSENDKEEL
mmetsp:Transcript_12752/g.18755  ORF Transcript_12752/g.18755 Transcript_12752/m.18755 type:complete len:287 (+) Transcript_12752:161-1021(+)|eukprot:CAMPEP_0194205420 /NCGR_PEP_ID=MMETSP0156-20130528/4692_1 /TAXON_ID=33649 /ORGANISM="Thalassionema nitzschioides, Strain L26-B" /LENGTH=286 /DNA_ID=CAMNT_0038931683 /DNA_START=142 /DNA_END=1002 /DNA_ORIENTATION=+